MNADGNKAQRPALRYIEVYMSNGPPGFLGLGEVLPRTCNFLTIFVGLYMIFLEADNTSMTELGLTTQQLGMVFGVVGLHGVFTKPSEVGIIRRFLSYMGAAPGALVIFWLGSEILASLS